MYLNCLPDMRALTACTWLGMSLVHCRMRSPAGLASTPRYQGKARAGSCLSAQPVGACKALLFVFSVEVTPVLVFIASQGTKAAGKPRAAARASDAENEGGLNLLSAAAARADSQQAAAGKAALGKAAAEAAMLPEAPVLRVEQRPLASLTER